MNTKMADILDRQSSAVERPKALPVGTYVWRVTGVPRRDKSAKKQTPFTEFTVAPLQAQDNVDPDDLKAALTRLDGETKKLSDQTKKITFYETEDALWRLVKFLDDCGAGDDKMTIRQRIEQAVGCQFLGDVTHSSSDDGEATYANITKTAPIE